MKKRILSLLPLAVLLIAMLCTPALALTEAEVEAQVAASSKEAVTGNVFIWFLCAVAFLKISQKIDSIMASSGINVGRTGGSLLGETMVAARAVSMVVKGGGRVAGGGGRQSGGSSNSAASNGSAGGFFKGGLIGMAGRHITNSAVKTATTQTAAVHTAQKQSDMAATSATSTIQTGSHTSTAVQSGGAHTASSFQGGGVHTASTFQAGSMVTDTTGIIQTEHSAQTATVQTDSSVYSGMDNSSSESHTASDVYADTMAQQEGIIITGHESQSAVFADSSSQVSTNSGGGSQVSYPDGGAPSAPMGGTPPASQPGGASQVSNSANSSQTVYSDGGGQRVHTQSSAVESTHTNSSTNTVRQTSIGGAVFARSLASGGKFANDVIGTVARGDIRSTGSITGDMAAQSLTSYMGYTALGAGARNIPRYSDVEIGGGRITGTEYRPGSKEGMAFGMYHAAQYTAPEGPHQKVYSADGTLWFKQYAQDAVERKPYKAPDGTVAYDEKIVKKLPTPPKRKDRI